MATFNLSIPDAQVPRITAALADTGQTPKQFLIAALVSFVRAHEEQVAREAALAAMPPVDPITIT